MIPKYELSHHTKDSVYKKSVYKKVAQWLPEMIEREINELYQKTLEDKTLRLYDIVVKALDGEKFRISYQYTFTEEEKSKVVRDLIDAGYKVRKKDFIDIILIANAIRDHSFIGRTITQGSGEQFRHASLNCFDYERMKSEVNKLADTIGYKNIHLYCPTLCRIYIEALENEHKPYPGRHLPYNNIIGIRPSSALRYQCLRLIDEILCTNESDTFFTLPEMEEKIRELAKKYDIEYNHQGFDNVEFNEGKFKHLYDILQQLISVEYSNGGKKNYERHVYDMSIRDIKSEKYSNSSGRRYKKRPNGKRLSAFSVDIAIREIPHLRKEIGMIRAKYFEDDRERFASEFPLIAVLGYMENDLKEENADWRIGDISTTDVAVVHYKDLEFSELKKKASEVISLGIPISIKQGNNWQSVIPLSIKEDKGKWSLITKSIQSNEIRMVSPEILKETLETLPGIREEESLKIEDHMIGFGDPLLDSPLDVSLELTDNGLREFENATSPLHLLSPHIQRTANRIYGDRMRAGFVSMNRVYINEDFLKEVYQLDRTAKFRSISPESVRNLYEEYFKKQTNQNWTHLDDRKSNGRIRERDTKKNRLNINE